MTPEWNELLKAVETYYGKGSPQWVKLFTSSYTVPEFYQIIKQVPGVTIILNKDGSTRGWEYENPFLEVETADPAIGELNSNTSTSTAVTVKTPINTSTSTDPGTGWEVVDIEQGAKTAGAAATTVGGLVKFKKYIPAAVLLASTATRAGLVLQPSYWETHTTDPILTNLKDIDPEKYEQITITNDEIAELYPGAELFDGMFRQFLSPITGEQVGEMYVDEEALAYMAKAMSEAGAFDYEEYQEEDTQIPDVGNIDLTDYFNFPIRTSASVEWEDEYNIHEQIPLGDASMVLVQESDDPDTVRKYIIGTSTPMRISDILTSKSTGETSTDIIEVTVRDTFTYDNKTGYYGIPLGSIIEPTGGTYNINKMKIDTLPPLNALELFFWNLLYGSRVIKTGGVEGLDVQDGANVLNIEPDDSISDIMQKMETQYPDMANKKIIQQVVQPDGSVKEYSYVPVPAPSGNPNTDPDSGEDPFNKPVSGDRTQDQTEITAETDEDSETEPITKYILEDITDPPEPVKENTGSGETPPIVIPTGSASALYTVYNPTNGEINSFGSWLWSANFVDQLLKMFNDPMQAIISLHKVFCSPSVSGRNNIKVGYLDSGVAANVVSAQYVTVDCGTVNLTEFYQNVFDYPPFTDVTIYLPFVGFVRLDTNDVMRASINVVYHVDVLTGACLAEVKVIRDSFGGVIYQYSGDCSVHYPLSSGSYMGIVSALLGVAGTVASGGALAPMAIGMAAGAMRGHANVERSGSLSGNAGAMGIKKPYLVVQRPQINTPTGFEQFTGKPSNSLVTIGECTGFIKCKEVHVINTPATESETQELVSLLKEGVIL